MRARENPFSADRLMQVRFRLGGLTREGLLERFAQLGRRAAIVGPEGSGKTTLLEDLGQELSQRGFRVIHLRATYDEAAVRGVSRQDAVLLDGAERLGWLGWMRFRRRMRNAGGLLITSHRPGLLPTLFECTTSTGLLEEIVVELLDSEAESLRRMVPCLYAQNRGNLRAALRQLYDIYAERVA